MAINHKLRSFFDKRPCGCSDRNLWLFGVLISRHVVFMASYFLVLLFESLEWSKNGERKREERREEREIKFKKSCI